MRATGGGGPSANSNTANHGTHVAGTAAGIGVNADGSTYTGTYSTNLNFTNFKVGPGVAPRALLYSLRVFGCTGTTDVADAAIDWAVDPNHDGDFSDHLDVVNLSQVPDAARRSVKKVSVGGAATPMDAKHALARIFDHAENDTRLFMEGVDEFWLTTGEHVAIPYAGVFEFRGLQVCEWREYFDGRISAAMKAGAPITDEVKEMIGRPVAK